MPMFDPPLTITSAPVLSKNTLVLGQKRHRLPSLPEHQCLLAPMMEAFRARSLVQDPFAEEQRPPISAQGHPRVIDPPSDATERSVQNAQLRFVGGTIVSSFLLTGIAAWLRLGPNSAFVFTLLIALSLLIHGFWTRNPLVKRLLVFGLMFGLGELASDYFCVAITQTLVYPVEGPLLWVSPAYMPIAWMVLMIQFGTLADALMRRLCRLSLVTVLMAVLGGLHIPIFETLAHHAGAWSYHNTPLILGTTPTYIILAEALLSLPLPWIVSRVKTAQHWWQPLSWGLAQAAWTLASVSIAFWLVGR